jgi:hypothetical protein
VWDVVGRAVFDGERMLVQRTWLWGAQTLRWALLLDFGVGGEPIEQSVTPGASFEADLCFYSGAFPLRAVLQSPPVHVGSATTLPSQGINTVLRMYAESLGRNPWLERVPVALKNVVPLRGRDEAWWVGDERGRLLPAAGPMRWHTLALSGGHPIDVFGEWDGFALWPLSAVAQGQLALLRTTAAA